MFGMTFAQCVVLALGIIALIKYGIEVWTSITKPNTLQDIRINQLELSCGYKHTALDKSITSINDNIKLIKENHLRHIEANLGEMKVTQAAQQATLSGILDRLNSK